MKIYMILQLSQSKPELEIEEMLLELPEGDRRGFQSDYFTDVIVEEQEFCERLCQRENLFIYRMISVRFYHLTK